MDIIYCDVVSSGQNPFGEVSRGVLRLQGYLIDANISTPVADQAESVDELKLMDKEGKWFASMETDEQDFWIPNVWCIPIKKIPVYAGYGEDKSRLSHNAFEGLVLVRTGAKENEYSRVGRFISTSEVDANEDRRDITII